MVNWLLDRQFVRFVLAGGIGVTTSVGVRWLLSLAMGYEVAVALAYLVGMATAFILFRVFVFSHSGKPVRKEMIWFALVNLAALAQVWVVSVGLYRYGFPAIDWTWHPDLLAHGVGHLAPIAASYFGHKHLTFSRRGVRTEPPATMR